MALRSGRGRVVVRRRLGVRQVALEAAAAGPSTLLRPDGHLLPRRHGPLGRLHPSLSVLVRNNIKDDDNNVSVIDICIYMHTQVAPLPPARQHGLPRQDRAEGLRVDHRGQTPPGHARRPGEAQDVGPAGSGGHQPPALHRRPGTLRGRARTRSSWPGLMLFRA